MSEENIFKLMDKMKKKAEHSFKNLFTAHKSAPLHKPNPNITAKLKKAEIKGLKIKE